MTTDRTDYDPDALTDAERQANDMAIAKVVEMERRAGIRFQADTCAALALDYYRYQLAALKATP